MLAYSLVLPDVAADANPSSGYTIIWWALPCECSCVPAFTHTAASKITSLFAVPRLQTDTDLCNPFALWLSVFWPFDYALQTKKKNSVQQCSVLHNRVIANACGAVRGSS